ncbi:hypothetical protein [Thiorhodovibrio winogradskyi]
MWFMETGQNAPYFIMSHPLRRAR